MGKLAALAIFASATPAFAGHPTPDGKSKINDNKLIDFYNSIADSTWTAGHNDFFHGMTFNDARPLLGTKPMLISEHLNETLDESVYAAISDATIPSDFDARTKWPGLIHPIRDQQRCGSCWAFSSSEVLSDRFAIATGKESPVLSPEDMVSCDNGGRGPPSDNGCSGGTLPHAWQYLQNTGIVTDKCFPYTAGTGQAAQCVSKCADGEAFTKAKAKSSYAINGVTNMQKEIMTNGPIQVAFMVYKSLMSYKSGVYQKHWYEFAPEGGHAVKILGWGNEAGTDYWLVANSWNTIWGMDGFFKIKRGSNQCKIESMGPPYAGMPSITGASTVVV